MRHFERAALALVLLFSSAPALAQRPPAGAKPKPKAVEEQAPPETDPQPIVVVTVPGGLTAEKAGRRAMATSYGARAATETAESASARSEVASLGYAPRLVLTGSYMRLSNFTPTSPQGNNKVVVTQAASGTVNPPTVAGNVQVLNPVILDQYVLSAGLTVPLSDYLFKTNKDVAAAHRTEDAARSDVLAARAASYQNGKIAYYNWLRTRGAVIVAEQALSVAVAHLKDAKTLFEGGNASSADVLRAETNVASAELLVETAKAGATNLDWHIRTVTHAPDEEKLEPGESLDGALPPAPDNLKVLLAEGYEQRPEVKSLTSSAEAARKLAASANAKRYPALNGVGEVVYSNPNFRKFPTEAVFFPSWSAGAVLTWSPNDFFAAGAESADASSRAASLEAQALVQRDFVLKEVVEAYTALRAADAAVLSTNRQLESAVGGYRVARQLYQGGRTNGTAVLDAENALTAARFAHLNARADARISRAELDHAVGRDAHLTPEPAR